MESIIGAIITGGLALLGVIITNMQSNRKVEQQIVTAQKVTDVKIDNLKEEVKKHNDFGMRIPKLETEIELMKEDLKTVKQDVKDLKVG